MVTQEGAGADRANAEQEWVLLSYRVPREPSTPRIAIWRKLKDLGVAQVGDGLVALPKDARTKEHLEWVAAKVIEASGEAIVWVATPTPRRQSDELARQLRHDREAEYAELLAEIAEAGSDADPRSVARWRREWRRIDRRDYFRSDGRDAARLAIDEIASTGSNAEERAR